MDNRTIFGFYCFSFLLNLIYSLSSDHAILNTNDEEHCHYDVDDVRDCVDDVSGIKRRRLGMSTFASYIFNFRGIVRSLIAAIGFFCLLRIGVPSSHCFYCLC